MKTRMASLLLTTLCVTSQLSAAPLDVRGHWPLDDGAGREVADASGNGNVGVATNVSWTSGVRHCAAQFQDGGVIDCGRAASLCPRDGLTIEAWLKPWKLPYERLRGRLLRLVTRDLASTRYSYALIPSPRIRLILPERSPATGGLSF